MAIAIRGLSEDDLEVAGTILGAAYGITPGRSLELRRYLALQPDGWLLAMLDGRPAGMGGAVDYGPCAYLGMMAVLPELQRRGVGYAILEQVLAWLDRRGCPTILLDATDAGASLYLRFGFVDAGTTLLVRRDAGELPPRQLAVAPLEAEGIPAVAAFDALLYGARRDRMFASYLIDYPGRAFVARDARGQVSGYLVAQSHMIGPWAAQTAHEAEALLAAALALPSAGAPGVILPQANRQGVDLLSRYGFTQQRVLRHMRRGRPWPNRPTLYGQASFAIG